MEIFLPIFFRSLERLTPLFGNVNREIQLNSEMMQKTGKMQEKPPTFQAICRGNCKHPDEFLRNRKNFRISY